MNKVILAGNLGRDAETKFTPSGIAVTSFSVATTRNVKVGEQWEKKTDWHNVTLWRREGLANYLVKGTKVVVEGRMETQTYDKDGVKHYRTHVVADEIELFGGKNGGSDAAEGDGQARSNSGGNRQQPRPKASQTAYGQDKGGPDDAFDASMGITDDDVPF